jgi:hypothetical protein
MKWICATRWASMFRNKRNYKLPVALKVDDAISSRA